MRLTEEEVKLIIELRGLTGNPFKITDSQTTYRVYVTPEEREELVKKRSGKDEGTPVFKDCVDNGNFYTILTSSGDLHVQKDKIREIQEVYSRKGVTIDEACLKLRMTRTDFMLCKRTFNITKSGEPFPEFDFSDNRSIERMADYSRLKNKLQYRNQLEDRKKKDFNSKINLIDKVDYWIEQITSGLQGIPRQAPYPLANIEPKPVRAVLILADAHVGLKTENSYNKYNIDVFKSRINSLIMKVPSLLRVFLPMSLDIVDLGDSISGDIHASLRTHNEAAPVEQLQIYLECIEKLIRTLSEIFPTSFRYCQGNHERVDAVKDAASNANNFGNLIPMFLNGVFRDVEQVNIITKQSVYGTHEIPMFGYFIGCEHGHNTKIDTAASNWVQLHGKLYKEIFLGHFHHRRMLDCNGILVEQFPSICGVDEYALNNRKISAPGATLIIYDRTGRIAEIPIML